MKSFVQFNADLDESKDAMEKTEGLLSVDEEDDGGDNVQAKISCFFQQADNGTN